MKKKKIGIIAIMLVVLLFNLNVSHAAEGILGFLEYAEGAQVNTFGYTADDKLIIKNVTSTSLEVESPIIRNGTSQVTTYLFNVSAGHRANGNPTNFRCIYDIDSYDNVVKNSDKFRIELDISELNRNEIYYVYAIPIDAFLGNGTDGVCTAAEAKSFIVDGVVGKESSVNGEDPCFNINDRIQGEGMYCENHSSNGNNGNNGSSNGIVYSINNISFICNSNGTVTATRQSRADVDVDVLLRSDNEQTFKKIGTVNSDRKSYTFTPQEKDHFSVRFEPVDGTQKINEDGHCLVTDTPEVEPVNTVEPVVVGPKENIMIILFGTIILYIVYRIATRKRS